jgi:uncharacterized protein YdhG (YjbR/CyaY superfamily)
VEKEKAEAISKSTADHELKLQQLQAQVDSIERQLSETMSEFTDNFHSIPNFILHRRCYAL